MSIYPYRQHFLVEGQYLGHGPRSFYREDPKRGAPPGYAFFCPACADLWARCPVELASGGNEQLFQVLSRFCRKHQSPYDVSDPAGGLWLTWDQGFNSAFPEEVLRREFLLTLNHFDKECNVNS